MTAPHRRFRIASRVIAVVTGLFVVLSCPSEPPGPPAVSQCPHTWDHRRLTSTEAPSPITISVADAPTGGTAVGQSRGITNVPEYHDCQRLVATSGAYGPLVAAFARQGLDEFGPKLAELASSTSAAKALAAVEIWNVDSFPYLPLKIDTGFSCLYVERAGDSWRGKLVYYGYPQPNCVNAVDINAVTGLALSVRPRPTTSSDFQREDVPPVVRWEWDAARKEHYIGFKCDVATWCEAGLDGFTSAPAVLATDPTWPREVRRTFEIRGWLDEQVLANVPTGSGSMLTPSPVRATVVPHPALRSRTFGNFRGTWVAVGYVLMSGPDAAYATKLNFVPSTAGTAQLSDVNTSMVFICWAGDGTCEGAPSTTCAQTPGTYGAGKWLAKYTAPGRDPIYTCTTYRPHPLATTDAVEPYTLGTARWRWLKDDETTWIGCPHGCCETGGT